MKMDKSTVLFRRSLVPHCRRISTTVRVRTSTSPQRQNAALAQAAPVRPRPFTDIPGPLALPMLRHSAHVLPRIGSFHHTVGLGLLEGLQSRYGDLVRLAKASRKRPVLYVFDPEMMQEVYDSNTTEPPVWENSPLCQHKKNKLNSEQCPIQLNDTKAIWAGVRTLFQHKNVLKKFHIVFDEIATDVTRRLGELRNVENALNEELETEVYRWALESIGVMIFGIRLGCLDGDVHKPTPENKNPEKTTLDDDTPDLCSLSKRALEELTPAESLVRCIREVSNGCYLTRSEATLRKDSPTFNEALKACDRIYSLTEHFLNQAEEQIKQGVVKPEQVLFHKLLPLEKHMLPLAADVFLAGADPLAQTALSMFHHLSLHAARQQRAHDEVRWASASAAEEGPPAGPHAGPPASTPAGPPAGPPELPYVAACAREALRLTPPTGGVLRRTTAPIIVSGYEVPTGVDIVLAHGVTSKSEKQWGRSKALIPERWCNDIENPLRATRAHPLASLPFGEICPASGIADKMLSSILTRVLDKYRLEWHGPTPNMVTTGVNKLQPPYFFVLQNAA